jgi:hypothetical protein
LNHDDYRCPIWFDPDAVKAASKVSSQNQASERGFRL